MFRRFSLALATVLASVFVTTVALSTPALAAPTAKCNTSLLGIPAWYANGVADATSCEVKAPDKNNPDGMRNFIVKIALNIIQAALVVVGYVAAYFIMKGGFLYVLARGEAAHLTEAKQTITNAIIGLIIAILSAAIVGAISGAIKV